MRGRDAAALYLAGTLLQRGAGLITVVSLVPLVAIDVYGFILLLTAAYAFFAVCLGFGTEIPLSRAAARGNDVELARLRRGLRWWSFAVSATAVAATATAWPLLRHSAEREWAAFAVESLSAATYAAFMYPEVVVARARGLAARATGLAVISIVVPQLLRITFTAADASALAFALGGLAGHLLVLPCFDPWTKSAAGTAASGSVRPGLPFLPHTLSHWVMALSDRFFLAAILGASAVAVYGLNYQFTAVLGLVFAEINKAVVPRFGGTSTSTADLRTLSWRVVRAQLVLTAIALMAAPALNALVVPAALQLQYQEIAVLLLAQQAYGFYLLATNELTLRRGDTRIAVFSLIAAAVNVLLIITTVPALGLRGAVLTTSITYSLLATLVLLRVHWGGRDPGLAVRPLLLGTGAIAVASALLTFVP